MKSRKYEIVEALAVDRTVEAMIANIAHRPMSPDLEDLAQMVYLVLLEYDEDKIVDLWEHEQMQYFIARIVVNQYRSANSPFHKLFRKYQAMTFSLDETREL